ncbi:rhomboid family intramembrane serine protease [Mucilaginibacter celer]|uniref:Rhomboid family intramembrane serine protease n=1 Tax=Mucilaginibacter celer TaxID=2305508 RepID=A0A494VVL6_9SPHI|nr:rhomboid family intramembrane serine protease [Mucilaginibacter celer]AYL95305.1 rhomboid family intramembrane serine protease [Mucilaginibacter celer]
MTKYFLPDSFSLAPATYTLMISILFISVIGFYHQAFFYKLILHPYTIVHKREYYRLCTSDFVHVDFVHLILNLVAFYVICSDLEELLNKKSVHGSLHFLTIYAISMLTANITATIRSRNNFNYSSAGASGSIMGCLFAFMLLDPFGHAVNIAVLGPVKNIYTAPLYIAMLTYYKWKKKNEAINHDLHLYGAIGGIAASLLF